MNGAIKAVAGLGFGVSPLIGIPNAVLSALYRVNNISACVDFLDGTTKAIGTGILHPCYPANPSTLASLNGSVFSLNAVFVIVGLALLVWAVVPLFKSG